MTKGNVSHVTCRCERGTDPLACCARADGTWYKQPERIEPAPPQTGFSHPGCYLRDSGDCDHAITDEHYVSSAALKAVDTVLSVSGLPWLKPGDSKNVPAERLVSRVLCRRHNNSLGPLDAQGARFVRWILTFGSSRSHPEVNEVLFNGLDLERWCLKTFLGLLSSASLQVASGVVVREVRPLFRLIDLLSGRIADEHGRGLWVRTDAQQVSTKRSLSVSPVWKPGTNRLSGLTLNIGGFDFLYSTAPILVEDSVFRPSQLRFRRREGLATIDLSWPPGASRSGPVEWRWSGSSQK